MLIPNQWQVHYYKPNGRGLAIMVPTTTEEESVGFAVDFARRFEGTKDVVQIECCQKEGP